MLTSKFFRLNVGTLNIYCCGWAKERIGRYYIVPTYNTRMGTTLKEKAVFNLYDRVISNEITLIEYLKTIGHKFFRNINYFL